MPYYYMARIKMVGRDVDTSPTQHRTWVVENQLDLDGYYYTGVKGGANPLVDVFAYAVPDGYVADFNLPNPENWDTTYRVLPEPLCDSHLLTMDGYIYLFGGRGKDTIFKATTGNPAYWLDTYSTLPSNLGAGQLAVIDGYTYIFGGHDGYATNKVFSAQNSNLLTWTDHGAKLPRALYNSHLLLTDGYIYLIGGNDGYGSTNVIFYAATADPLTWTESVATLPVNVEASHLLLNDGYVYLLGGLINGTPSEKIYKTPLSDLSLWSYDGALPNTIYFGQLVTIGSKAYLYAIDTYNPQGYGTKIFYCDLSNPLLWSMSSSIISGTFLQSQLAFIGDRMFLFGGNGSSVIFANSYQTVYQATSASAVSYGNVTRTQYQAASDGYEKFQVLGYPYWKTNY